MITTNVAADLLARLDGAEAAATRATVHALTLIALAVWAFVAIELLAAT